MYNIHDTCQVENLNQIFMDYFGYKNDGWFVEIGAFDGVSYSNTWALAVAGWKGLCAEPVPEYAELCRKNHESHDVTVVETCVGNAEGFIDFSVAGVLSTYSKEYLNSNFWKNDYAIAKPIKTKITTLDNLLCLYNIPVGFDVLSVDVEGSETDVLKNFNVNYWKPKMAIIEAHEKHPAQELTLQAPFINEYFNNAGYRKIYCDIINSIYVL